MKPVIGITAWRRNLDTFIGTEPLQTLATHYSDAVLDAGMTPIIFPNGQHQSQAEQLVAMVDGVLLSGGDDIDPATYGQEVTESKHVDIEVDGFEIAVINEARRQDKPVLAICRGLQILNVALGGTLHQDVLAADSTHELIPDDVDPDELNERRHVVQFEPDSILSELYDSSEAKVNTLHHQGLAELAPGLIIEGRTDDGLIEAARCDGSWWALGVQWHPERLEGEHQNLFTAFRDAVEAAAP